MKFRFTRIVVLLLLGVSIVLGQSSQDQIHQKLHPAFQNVIASDGAASLSKTGGGLNAPISTMSNGKLLYDVIITTTDPDVVRALGIHVNSAFDQYVTAQVSREDILNLVQRSEVKYLDPGSVNYPTLDISVPEIGADLLHSGFLNRTPYTGKGVIIVVFDSGIDWRHLDFRDPTDTTKSRILSIWDQTLSTTGTESTPALFSYGVEYTKQQIEAELSGATKGFVRERDINGHGSHVAGIVAGNGNSSFKRFVGVAPEADIVVVKGGDGTFSSTRIIDGMTYASNKAASNGKPVVVNLSLGSQSGSHDGTSAYETAINSFVSSAGKVVTVSAGNDGDGLIHISGNVSPGNTTSISVTVPAYTPNAGANNDKFQLDIWFSNLLGITAETVSPNNVHLQVSADNSSSTSSADGSIDMYNFNSQAPNFSRVVQVVASDNLTTAPKTGVWKINLTGANTTASFDAWLSSTSLGGSHAYLTNGDNNKTVAMPGTAEGAITVAAYVTKNSWPSVDGNTYVYSSNPTVGARSSFSSIGPTGDGRQKPDIAAPGQGIVSVLSSSVDTTGNVTSVVPGAKYQLMQGTSQAAPHIAGTAALLLQADRTLTAAKVKSYITSTGRSDSFTLLAPNYSWGYGKVDAYKAVEKVFGISGGGNRTVLSYASASRFYTLLPSTNLKMSMRFTPTMTGKLSSVGLSINGGSSGIKGSGSLKISALENASGSVAGIPGSQIGSSVAVPFSSLNRGAVNAIDMSGANVNVVNGTDFHIVLEVVGSVGDTLQLLLDDGTTSPTNRASAYRVGVNGLGWYNRVDPNYASGRLPSYENIIMSATVASVSTEVVKQSGIVPTAFALADNYPNPFNPSTSIRYAIPIRGRVRLRVFDLIGREVTSLVDELQAPGSYLVNWHGTDNLGVPLPSGVYFYRLESVGSQLTKKMILLK